VVLAGAECVRPQHDVLQVAHHGLDQGGQRLPLQGLQEGLVKVLGGVPVARVKAIVAERLVR